MFPTPAIRSWLSRNAFTGALRPAARARIASPVKSGLERLHAEPGGEVLVEGRRAEQHDAGAEPALVHEQHPPVPSVRAPSARAGDGDRDRPRPPRPAAGCRSSAGASPGARRPRAPPRSTCRAAPPTRSGARAPRRPPPPGAAGSHQRASSTSSDSQHPPLHVGRQLAADRLDLGQLGHQRRLRILPVSRSVSADRAVDRAVEVGEVRRGRRQLDHVLGAPLVDVQAAGAQARRSRGPGRPAAPPRGRRPRAACGRCASL